MNIKNSSGCDWSLHLAERIRNFFATLAFLVLGSSSALAGTIILTGTDAISLHGGPANYSTALFQNLGGSSSADILVLNNFGGGGSGYTGWAPGFTYTSSLASYNLGDYAGLFIASPDRCCGDPYSAFGGAAFDAQISAYVAGGGNLAIENFLGGYGAGRVAGAWTAILGFDPIGGLIGSGMNDGGPCDPATATAQGLAAGYPGSASAGCFNHQGYSSSFFAAKGYDTMMVSGSNAVVLQKEATVAVPEPGTIFLIASGLIGIALRRRS